jgi:hypothetical protein
MLKLVSNKELEVELAVKPSNREAGSTHAKCWHRWHRQCVCHRVLAAATSKPQVRLESKPAAVSDAALGRWRLPAHACTIPSHVGTHPFSFARLR